MSSTEYDPEILQQLLDAEAKKQREELIKKPGSEYKNAHTYFNPLKFFGIVKDKKQKYTSNKRPTPPKNHFHPDDENEADEGNITDEGFKPDQKINPNTTRRSHDAPYYRDRWIRAANKKIAEERGYSHYPDGPDPDFEGYNPQIINKNEVENSIINPDRKSSEHYSSKIISVPNVLKPRGGKTRKSKNLKKTKPKATKKAKKSSKRRKTKKRSSHK